MLDEKDLQSIQTMIDASIRASEKRMIAYFDTDVMPKFDLLAEGLQDVQAKLTPMTRIEAIEDDVALLKQVIRSMSKAPCLSAAVPGQPSACSATLPKRWR